MAGLKKGEPSEMKDDRADGDGLGSDRDELDRSIDALADAGFSFPVREETLERWAKAAELQPSAELRDRVARLVGSDSRPATDANGARTFGQTLASWRTEAGLTPPEMAQRVGLHREVIVELEAGEIFPETQRAETWRAIAQVLGRQLSDVRALIANTARTSIHPQGSPAARLERKLWSDRARFLTQDESREEAKLNARRAALLEALEKE